MPLKELREQLLNVADSAIKYARDLNVPSAETFVFNQSLTNLSENKGKVDSRDGIVQGVGIRVADGKKLGFATCTGFDEKSLKTAIKKAYDIAKVSPENPHFDGFVADSTPSKEGVLDPDITTIDANTFAEDTETILSGVDRNDQRIIGVSVNLNTSWQGYSVGTTEGCLVSTLSSVYIANATAIVIKDGDRKTGGEFVLGRTKQDVSGLGTEAVEKALNYLGSKNFEGTEVLPIILHPRTSSAYFSVPFFQGLSGMAHVEKRNPLSPKLGKQILHEKFTMIDDGQSPDEPSTVAVDGEGNPVGKTEVIKDGILKTFLYDKMYGKAAGLETTGNAQRGGGFFGGIPFESIPGIGPRVLQIQPVGKSLDEQITGCEKGIYVEGMPIGLFTANPITGDYSVTSNNSFLVENGEIKHPLKSISIAGNYFKAMLDIGQIGSDNMQSQFPVNSPTITVNNQTISG